MRSVFENEVKFAAEGIFSYHVDGQFTEISVQLTGESEAGGDSGHGGAHEVVKVTIGGGSELKGAEANVVKGLVVDAVGLVGVFDKLMDGKGGVVGLDNSIRYLTNKRSNKVIFCI